MKAYVQLITIACCISLTGCATMQRTDLYFGRTIPGGGQVTDEQWKNFSDSVISRYFPEGYTEVAATGRWRDTQTKETITEPSVVVTFLGKASARRNAALDSVTRQYIRGFHQQSVLRADSKTRIRFIEKTP
ncbi:DUF3574 domain-containing protein [Mucilaginibacter mali]|uniref:DUF3574 domain-containing protein n=1 Tax=Mucilaginibacter mali TaxID=2740462 RepID=A0A7D4UGS5_9SPHI|nr:DUF3574 domain-containing protein [Mucilaginibacter mali]QKJ32216.1 DUF3574 domain-containing protein [Mucilaginibacter mali]